MHDQLGLHHFHKRKNMIKKLERYPSKNKFKRLMDKLIYVVAVCGPLVALPQVFQIWISKNVVGVSLITWIGFLVISLFWLTYGILHKEKPIILMNSLWIIIYSSIIAGVFLFQ